MTATLNVLVSFDGTDGGQPYGGVIVDADGNLLGTTAQGGTSGDGTVFEIAGTATGYDPNPTILLNFNDTNGSNPQDGLIADASGDLFGTTADGGANDVGTVFEIASTSTGYASTPTTLVSFGGTLGAYPCAGLSADANGDLFGTALLGGGYYGVGTVFEIVNTPSGFVNGAVVLTSLGLWPFSGLITDANGDLFGTTSGGFPATGPPYVDYGMVFEIARTATGYAALSVLADFGGGPVAMTGGVTGTPIDPHDDAIGAYPHASLIADANGDLFGTTEQGGADGDGTVFEIAKTSSGYASSPAFLVSFNGTNGSQPYGGLIADARGDLFGTTSSGGAYGDGTVFEIAKTTSGYATNPTTLISFNGTNGASPCGNLIFDANGNLFGTTTSGGANDDGTVFEITGGTVPKLAAPDDFAGAGTSGILFGDPTTGAISDFLMNNGQPTWAGIGWADPGLRIVGTGNVNGGGTDDILFRDPGSGALGEFAMAGNQPAWETLGSVATTWQVAGIGDFNGDGIDDVLFRDPSTGALGDWLMNNGQPTWADVGWTDPQWQVAGVGNFDGGGTDNILFRDPTSGALGEFAMNDNRPTWAAIGWADPALQVAGVGDFNGDGTDDILFRDPTSGALSDFVMNNGQPTWEAVGWADPALQVAGVGDYNGDGTSDILFRDPAGGGLGQFVMSNNQPTWAGVGWAATNWQVVG